MRSTATGQGVSEPWLLYSLVSLDAESLTYGCHRVDDQVHDHVGCTGNAGDVGRLLDLCCVLVHRQNPLWSKV